MSFQRAVTSPESPAGSVNTISRGEAPFVGSASFVRTPSAPMISADAVDVGTSLVNVRTQRLMPASTTAPSAGLLVSSELCALALPGPRNSTTATAAISAEATARGRGVWTAARIPVRS